MKKILSLFFVALVFVTSSYAVEVGDTQAQVTTFWGQPVAVRTKAGGAQVWKMKDGTTVWLTQGVVHQIAAPTEERAKVVAAPVVAETIESADEKPAEGMEFPFRIGHLLFGVGLMVVVVTKFQYCQAIFKGRGWQLFGCMIPFVSFAFIFSHWKQTKKLFAWQMFVALPLFLIGFHLVPTSSALERTGPGRAASTHSPTQPRSSAR